MKNFKTKFYSWKVIRVIGLVTCWLIAFSVSRLGYINLGGVINNYLTNTPLTGEKIVNKIESGYFSIMLFVLFVMFVFDISLLFARSDAIQINREFNILKRFVVLWIIIGLFAFLFTVTTDSIPTGLLMNALLGLFIARFAQKRDEKNMIALFYPVFDDIQKGNRPESFEGFYISEIKKIEVDKKSKIENEIEISIVSKFKKLYKIKANVLKKEK